MRACLIVGSAEYDDASITPLDGTLIDAAKMYEALCSPLGEYGEATSRKLVSPTLQEMRKALAAVLKREPLDVFSFFFAGHGEVRSGTFYMILRDTDPNYLAGTAFPITELFNHVNESRPRQINIVLDACRSGGVALDLSHAIRPDVLGIGSTSATSVFASAHIDQSAGENDKGGFATGVIVDVLRGTLTTSSRSQYLDLVTVGERVSTAFVEKGMDQAPIYWGLNLTGSSRFVRNPHAADNDPTTSTITGIAPRSPIGQRLNARREPLWRAYLELGREVRPKRLLGELRAATDLLSPTAGEVSDFLLGLTTTLPLRSREVDDRFAEAQVLAICATALLQVVNTDPGARIAMELIAKRFALAITNEAHFLEQDLQGNWRCLLSRRGGFDEFAVLPMRISKLLGYLAAADTICDELSLPEAECDATPARSLVQKMIDTYSTSLACISDAQSAPLAVFFGSRLANALNDQAETIFGSLFSDFVSRKGAILEAHFDGKAMFRLIWERATGHTFANSKHLARPTSMLAVFLAVAASQRLEDTVDPYLHELDHHAMNVFVPVRMSDFSQSKIEDGVNVSMAVGWENPLGVFTTGEFNAAFRTLCRPLLQRLTEGTDRSARLGAMIASLVLPDRVAWHLLESRG